MYLDVRQNTIERERCMYDSEDILCVFFLFFNLNGHELIIELYWNASFRIFNLD